MTPTPTETQCVVRWYPPAYDIRVETAPVPSILHPDDAIVKIKLAGLCGSDLHLYRGHEEVNDPVICGHEFVGEVVALGDSFSSQSTGRPLLYSILKVGDKVISPFTVSCGECQFCRRGVTSRCVHSQLFGSPNLPGGQAQYTRVPRAGGTLFKVDSIAPSERELADSSLLLMADILPTGVFAAMQVLQHPKISPFVTGAPYPFNSYIPDAVATTQPVEIPLQDRTMTLAVVGLGPVGVCATVSLLDLLADVHAKTGINYQIVAVDRNPSRREKMRAVLSAISINVKVDTVKVEDIPEAQAIVAEWTDGIGCNAVLEIVGNNSALKLAYDLVGPFGLISSVGVHQAPPLPLTGREVYDKNVSFDFGRCPVRSMFPIAAEILLKRQDVFGGVGETASLIDRVVGFQEAAEVYEAFDKGLCGKILFDPSL